MEEFTSTCVYVNDFIGCIPDSRSRCKRCGQLWDTLELSPEYCYDCRKLGTPEEGDTNA